MVDASLVAGDVLKNLLAAHRGEATADVVSAEPLSPAQLADLRAALAEVTGKDRMAVERFLAIHRSMHLRPFTLVRYQREPYFSRIDDYARVTFDTHIRAQAMDRLSFDAPDRGWRWPT